MSLKSPTQLSSVAEYKKLIQTDARSLSAVGAKFHYFTKYTFGDKSVGPLLLFGAVDNTLLSTISKSGTGPANGRATINDADEIVLEVAIGKVAYSELSKAFKGLGVIRQLFVPEGAEESETSSEEGGAPKPTPVAGKAPVVPPRPVRPGASPAGAPSGQQGMAAKGAQSKPTAPEGAKAVVAPGVAPLAPPRPPRAGEIPAAAPKPADPQAANPAAAKGSLAGGPPPVPPRTTKPGAAPVSPGAQPPQKPAAANPTGTSPAQGGTTPPKQPPPAVPAHSPKRIFDDRFKLLKPRYDAALNGPIPGVFQPLFDEMIAKAKLGDFPGALLGAGKLDAVLNKVEFAEQKSAKQEHRAARLSETFNAVKKSYFTPGSAAIIESQNPGTDEHFGAFISAQKAFENVRDEKSLDILETRAQAYCSHFQNDLGPRDQKKSDNEKKLSVCQTALKAAHHFRLALQQDKIGSPPWDEEKEIRATELYSKMLFEQEDGKVAEPNASEGVSGSWWVEKTDFEADFAHIRKQGDPKQAAELTDAATPKRQMKTFIFKPTDAEGVVEGFPKGGSAAREVLGKAIGDQIQALTGFNLAVPETALIAVDSSKLQGRDGKAGSGQPRVGSVQHFTKARGEFNDIKRKDPGFLASLSEDEVHQMAVFDLIQLNMDRHGKNFMVGEDGGKAKLVPIDHGLVIPSRTGLTMRRARLGPPSAALGTLPCANKKFAPELVEKIKQIDPDEVVAAMKKSYDAMARLHPEAAKAADISEENFKLTKRSIQFLKKVSGELTLAEIQDAYVASLEEIFDTPDDQMEAGFDEAIRREKSRGVALKELVPLIDGEENRLNFDKALQALGWGMELRLGSADGAIAMNPDKVLKIYKNKIENPAARKELNELLSQVDEKDRSRISGFSFDQQILTLRGVVSFKTSRKAAAYGLHASMENGQMIEAYEALGGDDQFKQLKPDGSALPIDKRFEALAAAEITKLGGDAALTKIAKLYPEPQLNSSILKLLALQDWHEYERLGGDKAASRLGVSGGSKRIDGRLAEMKCILQIAALT